jgi:protein required for attachment to host cells
MNDIRVPWKSWVVVCDGAKALILQNAGDAELMNLQLEESLTQPALPDREMAADRPGRTRMSGLGSSAMEETSLHELASADFLKEVAGRMLHLVRDKDARQIVLVAPPTALGTLRPQLGAEVQSVITAELAKNFTNMPIDQIEKHLH